MAFTIMRHGIAAGKYIAKRYHLSLTAELM